MKKINIDDPFYPEKLKKIPKPPLCLYTEGNLDLLNTNSIAIIGSRVASENGKKFAKKFATELSQIGLTIISGLARGIDTVAHAGSYNQVGKTIAVLGCGFNKIYPPENLDLYKKILDNNGLVLSEYSPDTEAQSSNFINRNRIISGLALGILVVEAKSKSGTGKTAKIAKKQGKAVFALPHEIDDLHGVGTNRLIKNGAILTTETTDILNKLKLVKYKEEFLKLNNCNHLNPKIEFSDSKQSTIFGFINKIPISANDLSRKTGYTINEILSTLFIFEMNGYIKKVSGGYITCT